MNKTAFHLVVLISLLSACAKQGADKPTHWLTYTDPIYPISLQYPDFPALEVENDRGGDGIFTYASSTRDRNNISVEIDLRTDFSKKIVDEVVDSDDGRSLIARVWLLNIEFCPERIFKEARAVFTDDEKIEEITINSIPTLWAKNKAEPEDITYLIPLIPGHYVFIQEGNGRLYDSELNKKYPEINARITELSHKTLNSIHWNQPIDTNSQEFKDWKAHILSLIEESRQSAKKKSGQ